MIRRLILADQVTVISVRLVGCSGLDWLRLARRLVSMPLTCHIPPLDLIISSYLLVVVRWLDCSPKGRRAGVSSV